MEISSLVKNCVSIACIFIISWGGRCGGKVWYPIAADITLFRFFSCAAAVAHLLWLLIQDWEKWVINLFELIFAPLVSPAISSGNAWSYPSWMTSVSKCWRSVMSLWGCRCPMRSTSAWRSFYCSAQVLQSSSLWTVVPLSPPILLTTIVLYYYLVAPAMWKQCHFFVAFSLAQMFSITLGLTKWHCKRKVNFDHLRD